MKNIKDTFNDTVIVFIIPKVGQSYWSLLYPPGIRSTAKDIIF